MHRNLSSVQQAQHFSPFITRKNPYKEWGMWGGILTALSVAATIAFSAFGIALAWPIAIAVLGALFTVLLFSASNSYEKTTERNEVLTEKREHEKALERQQEIEKQIQKNKEITRKMQMKEEEAQMEKYEKTYTKFTTAAQYTNANGFQIQQPTQQELQQQLQSLVREGWIEGVNDLGMGNIINSNIKSIAEFRFKEGGEINQVRITHAMRDGQTYTDSIVVNPINPNAPKNIQKKIEEKQQRR